MTNYISTNFNLIKNKINKIKNMATKSEMKNTSNNKNTSDNKKMTILYKYKKFKIKESDINLFNDYDLIDIDLYKQICNIEIPNYFISYYLLNTNGLNILDGLFEEGSEKINIENSKNVFTSKIKRYSEYFGYIEFTNKKMSKITIENKTRIDNNDSTIYMPKNTQDTFNYNYIFHTHPKTPNIGSRFKQGILYEFPSVSDIIHFIDHHNYGKLLGSIVVAPEGVYIIRKNVFNRNKIKIDYDIFINEVEDIMEECRDFINYEYENLLVLKEISYDYFYTHVANNLKFINHINKNLVKYDIHIDYYARAKLVNTNKWLFPDILVPMIS
jgi:hypothetical protein